ncbi:MAG: hypothetical protein WBD31_29475 [Rubripirellula sp.]
MFLLRQARPTVPRRAISTLLLVVLVCGLFGLPIASPPTPKHGRFPCEDCACGCSTADYCWDKCCCYSDTEKLQWAAANDVRPPDFLVARVDETKFSGTVTVALKSKKPAKSCCGCAASSPNASAKCHAAVAKPSADQDQTDTLDSMRLVRLEDAAHCRGIDLLWTLYSCVNVESRSAVTAVIDPILLFCFAINNDQPLSISICPDPPIP